MKHKELVEQLKAKEKAFQDLHEHYDVIIEATDSTSDKLFQFTNMFVIGRYTLSQEIQLLENRIIILAYQDNE